MSKREGNGVPAGWGCSQYGGCTELWIPASGTQAKGELWSPDSETVHQSEGCYFPSALGGHSAGMRVSATAVLRGSRKCVEKGTCLGRGAVIPRHLFFFFLRTSLGAVLLCHSHLLPVITHPSASSVAKSETPKIEPQHPSGACECTEQPRSWPWTWYSHRPAPFQYHVISAGLLTWLPSSRAAGDTSLEWLQHSSLKWVSPSFPLPEEEIWGRLWGEISPLDPSLGGRGWNCPSPGKHIAWCV